MKARKPQTDQDMEVNIYANGRKLPQYVLPGRDNSNKNIVECFVPVKDGEELTLIGTFNGSILHGAFDLVADGAFVWDTRVEGGRNNFEAKYCRRKRIEPKSTFNNPKDPGWQSIEEPPMIVEGNLHVKSLSQADINDLDKYEIAKAESAVLGVGSIAMVVSLNKITTHNYHEKYWKMRIGAWREREGATVHESGIKPDHELTFETTYHEVNPKRASKHKRHWDQIRFGKAPWAKFVFHYRSLEAIEAAGCVQRSENDVQDLVAEEDAEQADEAPKPRLGGYLDLSKSTGGARAPALGSGLRATTPGEIGDQSFSVSNTGSPAPVAKMWVSPTADESEILGPPSPTKSEAEPVQHFKKSLFNRKFPPPPKRAATPPSVNKGTETDPFSSPLIPSPPIFSPGPPKLIGESPRLSPTKRIMEESPISSPGSVKKARLSAAAAKKEDLKRKIEEAKAKNEERAEENRRLKEEQRLADEEIAKLKRQLAEEQSRGEELDRENMELMAAAAGEDQDQDEDEDEDED